MFTLYDLCSVNWGIFSTSGDVQYMGGYHEYTGALFSTSGDIIMNVGGYHVYIGGCSIHRRNIISTWGEGGGGNIMSTLGDVQHIRSIS